MEVLSLLQSERSCLERLLEVTEAFDGLARQGDWSGLEAFNRRRSILFRVLDLVDQRITQAAQRQVEISDSDRLEMKKRIDEKADLIRRILTVDEALIQLMESEAGTISQQLLAEKRNRDTLSKFKSSWVAPSGQEMDSQV